MISSLWHTFYMSGTQLMCHEAILYDSNLMVKFPQNSNKIFHLFQVLGSVSLFHNFELCLRYHLAIPWARFCSYQCVWKSFSKMIITIWKLLPVSLSVHKSLTLAKLQHLAFLLGSLYIEMTVNGNFSHIWQSPGMDYGINNIHSLRSVLSFTN